MAYEIMNLRDHPEWLDKAAAWFHAKWGIPLKAYQESMEQCVKNGSTVPQWYMATEGREIIGGLGVMRDIKNYRLGFDPWGLTLFLIIMLPNFVWFAIPAPNDIMRQESVTPLADSAAQVFQVIMTAALCAVVNMARDNPMKLCFRAGAAVCVTMYFAGWAAYYAGLSNAAVILDLCLAPCGAFLLFALARKNGIALTSAGLFTICHLIFIVINFLI